MIPAPFSFALIAALLLGIAWATALLGSPDPAGLVAREREFAQAAFPAGLPPGLLAREPFEGTLLPANLPSFFPLSGPGFQAALAITRLHAALALRLLPSFALAFLAGFFQGAALRERLRFGTGYASPTVAYLAKRFLGMALLYVLLWALSPLSLPYFLLYIALAATLSGVTIYAANLPMRI